MVPIQPRAWWMFLMRLHCFFPTFVKSSDLKICTNFVVVGVMNWIWWMSINNIYFSNSSTTSILALVYIRSGWNEVQRQFQCMPKATTNLESCIIYISKQYNSYYYNIEFILINLIISLKQYITGREFNTRLQWAGNPALSSEQIENGWKIQGKACYNCFECTYFHSIPYL